MNKKKYISTSDDKKIKVSIICSVFNRQRYLHQCVDSILNQSLKEIELILINNGSTDNTAQIVNEYAKKDKRVVAIHNAQGSTYGKALNQGIALAQGEYIGIVESDDFISNLMYEKLYNKITKFDADVCFSGFWVHINDKNDENNIHNKQIFANTNDKELFSVLDYPFLLTVHQSIWAKLYRSDFLKKIKFDETGTYIDSKFMIDVLCTTKKLISLKEPVYYYRFDNPDASNSNKKTDSSLIYIVDDWEKAKNALKKHGYYKLLKDEFYFLASKSSYRFFCNINSQDKRKFFNKWCNFVKELKKDKTYNFKYLDAPRIKFFKAAFYNNYKALHTDNYSVKKILGFSIKEHIVQEGINQTIYCKGLLKLVNDKISCKRYICGIRFYKKKDNVTNVFGFKIIDKPGVYKFNFLGIPLIQKKDSNTKRYVKLFYIPVYYRRDNSNNLVLNKINESNLKLDALQKHINYTSRLVCSAMSRMQAISCHKDTFAPYRNCFTGKSVVLVGCGPSIDKYIPIPESTHVGINRAFKKNNIKFDYLFAQDAFPEGMSKINNYPCTKFYGFLPNERAREVQGIVDRIKPQDFIASNAHKYIIEDLLNGHWATDLSLEPIGDFQSTVFSALQFICYCHPQTLYLVGCDCSNQMNSAIQVLQLDIKSQLNSWYRFKTITSKMYPDIEIISINPVGLKGLFHDVYTESYLRKHPEINCNEVEILNINKDAYA